MNYLEDDNIVDIVLDAADESAIFLAALQDTCTPEEFESLVLENTTELELYGLIDDAESAMEAIKIVKHKITKQENLNREQAKACFRMAKKANCSEWKRYHLYRTKMKAERDKIFAKFGSKAKAEAKKVVNNSRRKASSMNSVTGKTITEKMDKKIEEINE